MWGAEPRPVGRPAGEVGRSTAPLAGSSAGPTRPHHSGSDTAASGRRRGCRCPTRPPSTVGPSDESWFRARAGGAAMVTIRVSGQPSASGRDGPRVVPTTVEAGRFVRRRPTTAGHDAHGSFVRAVLHVPARRVTGRPSGLGTTARPGRLSVVGVRQRSWTSADRCGARSHESAARPARSAGQPRLWRRVARRLRAGTGSRVVPTTVEAGRFVP